MRHRGSLSAGAAPTADTWLYCACGERGSACVTNGGQLLTWGCAADGRLGHGRPYIDLHAPKIVAELRGLEVASVALGRTHGIAVTRSGRIYAWGLGDVVAAAAAAAAGGAVAAAHAASSRVSRETHQHGIPRPLLVPSLALAHAAGDAMLLCCMRAIELQPPGAASPPGAADRRRSVAAGGGAFAG